MTSVALPPWVAANLRRDRLVEETLEAIPYWNRLLRDLDERLSLVWVNDRLTRVEARRIAPEMVPGRWHVRRRNDGAKDSYMPVTTPDGGYRPMGNDILDELRSKDLWRGDVAARYHGARYREERQTEADRQRRRDERVDGMATAIKAVDSPGVLFSDVSWRSRSAGRKG